MGLFYSHLLEKPRKAEWGSGYERWLKGRPLNFTADFRVHWLCEPRQALAFGGLALSNLKGPVPPWKDVGWNNTQEHIARNLIGITHIKCLEQAKFLAMEIYIYIIYI